MWQHQQFDPVPSHVSANVFGIEIMYQHMQRTSVINNKEALLLISGANKAISGDKWNII